MLRFLARLEDGVVVFALAVFSFVVLLGVVFRYVLNFPLGWTNEVSLIAFSWMMFFGAVICVRRDEHILIDLIMPAEGSKVHRCTEFIASISALVVSLILAWVSYRYTVGAAPMVTPVLRLSSAVYNAAAPIGFLLICLHTIIHLAQSLSKGKSGGVQPAEK